MALVVVARDRSRTNLLKDVERIASRFGVEIAWVSKVEGGVSGFNCFPKEKRVVGEEERRFNFYAPNVLHEVGHIVCAYEGRIPTLVEEWYFQYQLERALAEVVGDPDLSDLVRVFQGWVEMPLEMLMEHGVSRFSQIEFQLGSLPWWHEGWERCQRLGLLDESFRPTWQYPDWSKLTPQERGRMADKG